MYITVHVNQNFDHPNIDVSKFTVDIDPKEPIENLKVILWFYQLNLGSDNFKVLRHWPWLFLH